MEAKGTFQTVSEAAPFSATVRGIVRTVDHLYARRSGIAIGVVTLPPVQARSTSKDFVRHVYTTTTRCSSLFTYFQTNRSTH